MFAKGKLQGKVAFVTGAARGIGAATAQLFYEEGANLVLIDTEIAGLTLLVDHMDRDRVLIGARNIGNESDMQSIVADGIQKFGRADVLANIAAVRAPIGPVTGMDADTWDHVLRVNITGAAICAKYVIPAMARSGGGSVINVSSVHAEVGRKGWSAYDATRGAVLALSRDMAHDHAFENIRVNVISPGPVITGFHIEKLAQEEGLTLHEAESQLREKPRNNLMNRAADPSEIARAILFLASEDSSFMTGSVMNVDGGY
ncbi:MAG: short-chain dehydrogenase [Homoserinimonas sp.]|nr:short-chain dehydrogenase [Homoserinimonas sp.]